MVQVPPHHLVSDNETPEGDPNGQLDNGGLLQRIHPRLGQELWPPSLGVESVEGLRSLLHHLDVEERE